MKRNSRQKTDRSFIFDIEPKVDFQMKNKQKSPESGLLLLRGIATFTFKLNVHPNVQ